MLDSNLSLPLVSVIVPAYNAEDFIEQTLNSILSQTYTNLEVLVVDDGSQDRTPEIIKSIAQIDPRVILLQQANAGVAVARNLAIARSSGEYIAPIDADDIWYPRKLEKQVECILKADSSVGLVYAWSVSIDEKGLIFGKYDVHDYFDFHSLEGKVYTALIYRNIVGNASVPLIRRSCFEKVDGYNYKLKEQGAQGCEDWELYLHIAEYYQFRVVPEFLIGYRQVTGSMSDNYKSMAKSYKLVMTEAKQRHPEISNAIYQWSASYFYTYLLWKSYSCKDYWITLVFLYKALELDLALVFVPWVHKMLIKCVIKLVVRPVNYLINTSLFPFIANNSSNPSTDLSKSAAVQISFGDSLQNLEDKIELEVNRSQGRSWKLYDRISWQRWLQAIHTCKVISS